MKQQVHPAITAAIIVVVIGIAVFALMKGTGGGGSLPTGTTQPGNAGPFSPGGSAVGKGGMPSKTGSGGNPMAPHP